MKISRPLYTVRISPNGYRVSDRVWGETKGGAFRELAGATAYAKRLNKINAEWRKFVSVV